MEIRESNMMVPSHPQWAWWEEKFPRSFRAYGCPIHWNLPNLDFLASTLGELPLGIVYFPPRGAILLPRLCFWSPQAMPERENRCLGYEAGQ